MRVLLLNQTFHPDVMATAQYLTDLARALAEAGHEVTVISGRRAYDDPQKEFPGEESWNGIRIRRVWTTRFGKSAKWKRAVDFASFIASCTWRLLFSRRPDVVVALTSPPLISFLGACFARWRNSRFVYWVMDLNPDEAIAAGWLRDGSLVARVLHVMSLFSLQTADPIVVLDRFMFDRVRAKGIAAQNIVILPPWSQDDAVYFDAVGRDAFRAAHGILGKFVVMYSGNHSPCHPLTNLLQAAQEFTARGNDRIIFCFVGGGSEFARVKEFAARHSLRNTLCLPYQPLDKLAGSLSAADLHVVVMGDAFVGTIHPCKIYNILSVRAPILYIGPEPSHAADILRALDAPSVASGVAHGDVAGTVSAITGFAAKPVRMDEARCSLLARRFSKAMLLGEMLHVVTAIEVENR